MVETAAGIRRKLRLPRLGLGSLLMKSFSNKDLSVQADGLTLCGGLEHRFLLYAVKENRQEPFMTSVFRDVVDTGDVVWDVGAHIGIYSLVAAKKGARVFALEPDPRSYRYLLRNIAVNGMSASVTPLAKAASQMAERRSLVLHPDAAETYLLPGRTPGEEPREKVIDVDCVALDELASLSGSPVVIKMDIEGGEIGALRGMPNVLTQGSDLIIFVECNPNALRIAGHDPQELVRTLERHDFTVRVVAETERELKPVVSLDESFWQGSLILPSVNLFCTRP